MVSRFFYALEKESPGYSNIKNIRRRKRAEKNSEYLECPHFSVDYWPGKMIIEDNKINS